MRDLAIDPVTGDLKIVDGDLVIFEGKDEVEQSLRIRLRMFLGEWFLDTRLGVDYFGAVLVKNPDLAAIESLLKEAILGTVGVRRLTRYSQALDTSARKLTVSFEVETEDEELLELNEVLGA